ncbi:MAG: hypothetical protein LBG44_04800 [Gemmatimonadota bacterium]|jgi:hypothetical protein|nr:hypothetical protein [Gemmatimonadota bacterium]
MKYLLVPFMGLIFVACGQPHLVVEAGLVNSDGERVALSELPVRLLPYDRDAIFDSLRAASPTPEPSIPPEVLANRQRTERAQATWRAAEKEWNIVRDSLRTLNQQLQGMEDRGERESSQHRQGVALRNRLDSRERETNRTRQATFSTFEQLQKVSITESDSIRIAREQWADKAFANFGVAAAARLAQSREAEIADTTDARGIVRIAVPRGQWWLYSRYTLPHEELYWNLPITVDSDSALITIDASNAESRPIL